MPEGTELLEQMGIQDPDEVCASEYRAIYEILADALTDCPQRDKPEGVQYAHEYALIILGEFAAYAEAIAKDIRKHAHESGLGFLPTCPLPEIRQAFADKAKI